MKKILLLLALCLSLFSLSACDDKDSATVDADATTSSIAGDDTLTPAEEAVYRDFPIDEDLATPLELQQDIAFAVAKYSKGDEAKVDGLYEDEKFAILADEDPNNDNEVLTSPAWKAFAKVLNTQSVTLKDFVSWLSEAVLKEGADVGHCIEGSNSYGGEGDTADCSTPTEEENSFSKDSGYSTRY